MGIKGRTTGADMVSDIVQAGREAGLADDLGPTCPECGEASALNEDASICFQCQAADYMQEEEIS